MKNQPDIIDKLWGREIWLVNNKEESYCCKFLEIDAFQSTSMHFHVNKHETFYVERGTLTIRLLDTQTCNVTNIKVKQGETFAIDRLQPHKLMADHEPVRLVETSTFHEDTDSYRVWR